MGTNHHLTKNYHRYFLTAVVGCADRRKLWVGKVRSMCCGRGHRHVTDSISFRLKGWQSLPLHKVRVLAVCAENIYHSFLPCEVCHLKSAPLQKLFLQRSIKPSLLDPTVHHKPCFLVYLYVGSHLVQLYAIALPPFSTLPNEHTELPGCCGVSSGEPSPLGPSHFWQRMYDPIFTSFPCCSSRVYPWSTGQCGRAWWHIV